MTTSKEKLEYKVRDMESISNIFSAARDVDEKYTLLWLKFLQESMDLSSLRHGTKVKSVQFYRDRLGKCSRIVYGIRRYHTWDRPLWTVYANNDYGAKFEVPCQDCWTKGTKKRLKNLDLALEAWRDYIAALGLATTL